MISAILALWTFKRPGAAFGLLLAGFAVEQWLQTRHVIFTTYPWLGNVAIALFVGMGILSRFMSGTLRLDLTPKVYFAGAALFAFWCMSFFWTMNPDMTFRVLVVEYGPYWLVFFFAPVFLMASWRDLRASYQVLLVSGLVLVPIFTLFSDWSGRAVKFVEAGAGQGSIRAGVGGNPLAIATYGGYVMLAALLLHFSGASRFFQIVRWGLVAGGLAIGLMSGSRGQIVAMLIAALAFLPMSRRIKNLGQFLGLGIALMLILGLSSVLYDTLIASTAWQEDRWQRDAFWTAWTEGRLNTSLILLERWLDGGPVAWIFGLGARASNYVEGLWFYPHLVMAEVLGELGLVGFVMLWLIPILAYTAAQRSWPFVKNDAEMRGVLATACAIFLFEVVLSFKQGSFFFSHLTMVHAVIIGRLAALFEDEHRELLAAEQAYDSTYYGDTPDDLASEYGDIEGDELEDEEPLRPASGPLGEPMPAGR